MPVAYAGKWNNSDERFHGVLQMHAGGESAYKARR